MTKRPQKSIISEVIFSPIIPTKKGVVCFVSFTYDKILRINDCAIASNLTNGDFRLIYPIKTLYNDNIISVVYPWASIEAQIILAYKDFLNSSK